MKPGCLTIRAVSRYQQIQLSLIHHYQREVTVKNFDHFAPHLALTSKEVEFDRESDRELEDILSVVAFVAFLGSEALRQNSPTPAMHLQIDSRLICWAGTK